MLLKTNCKECGQPTCLVFAAKVAEGAKGPDNCPHLDPDQHRRLTEYMGRFTLEM